MVLRVSIGAATSIVDAITDIWVIYTYYQSEELRARANLLLAMVSLTALAPILFIIMGASTWKGMG